MIWKARCSKVFNSEDPNWIGMGQRAIAIAEELCKKHKINSRELIHRPFNSSLSLFTDVAWEEQNQSCGTGFVLVNSDKVVVFAGENEKVESSMHAELLALEEALRRCKNRKLFPQHVYSDCITIVELIHKEDRVIT